MLLPLAAGVLLALTGLVALSFGLYTPWAEALTNAAVWNRLSASVVVLHCTGAHLPTGHGFSSSEVRRAVAVRVAPLGNKANKLVLNHRTTTLRYQATKNLVVGS